MSYFNDKKCEYCGRWDATDTRIAYYLQYRKWICNWCYYKKHDKVTTNYTFNK